MRILGILNLISRIESFPGLEFLEFNIDLYHEFIFKKLCD